MRVLATADVHVESWTMYEIHPGFRLKQYERLGKWLSHLVREYGVDLIAIAGDFFHKPTNPPKVLLTGVRLIKALSDVAPVVLIHGQHDIDTRDRVSEGRSNSLVSLLHEVGRDNVYYLHNSYVVLGGKKVFGYGWEPTFSPHLDRAQGAHLVLLHGQVRGSRARGAVFQEGIEPEKYFPGAWTIVGDVHQHQVFGKVVVPGPPIYHTFSDGSAGVVILDTERGEVEYLPSGVVRGERVYYFLQLVQSKEMDPSVRGTKDVVDEQSLTVVRVKGQTLTRDALSPSARNPLETIRQVAQNEGLAHAYEYLSSRIRHSTASPYDAPHYWVPLRLEVEGFRSIEHLSLDFGDLGKLIFVSGPNGSGKSSLLMALRFVLTGEGDKSLIMAGKEEARVSLTLEYLDRQIVVERSLSPGQSLSVWVDGSPLEAPSLREKQSRFEDLFPPARTFTEIAYFDQFRPGLVSSLPPKARVELVSQIFGLSVISDLEELAKEEVARVRSELASLSARQEQIASSLQSLEHLSQELSKLHVSDSEREEYEFLSSMVADLQEEMKRYREITSSLKARRTELSRKLEEIEEKLSHTRTTRRCYACGSVLNEPVLARVVESLQEGSSSLRAELSRLEEEYAQAAREEDRAAKSLARVLARYQELYGRISQHATLVSRYREVEEVVARSRGQLEEVSRALDQTSSWLEDLTRFSKILTTKAYAAVLERISSFLSGDRFRVSLAQVFKTGSVKPTVDIYATVSEGLELPFDLLSGGQRTLADLRFLFQLVSSLDGLGLMVFDETFRFLDAAAYEEVFELLQGANARHIIYVSHDISPAMRFDAQVSVSRIGGRSVYSLDL